MKQDKDCLFCKIVNKEIPSNIIYEDDNMLVFLDIGPINKGHTLILPKEHYETLLDLPQELLHKTIDTCQKVTKAVVKAMKADGFNLNLNGRKAAGQLVDHIHFHSIPRFHDDGFKHWQHGKYKDDSEAKEVAEKIKNLL